MILISIVSCISTILIGKALIPILSKLKFGQTILKIGPSWHEGKQGTPTMGGISFIFGIFISLMLCVPLYYINSNHRVFETEFMTIKLISGLLMSIGYACIGFIDDFLKIKNRKNLGLNAKQKLILQFMVASSFLVSKYLSEVSYFGSPRTFIKIPFFGAIDFDAFYWILSSLIIVGIVNAVNLTDGIDGLCGSVSLICSLGFILIAKLLNMQGMGFISSSMFGACLGFLFWNFHPAKMFMGDTGSLFLGGLICALGFATENIFLLIMFSMVYILEMFSVMLQVIYFKISKGKRLFKMSPIHHHFEMIGFSEKKICVTFSLVSALFVFLGIILGDLD